MRQMLKAWLVLATVALLTWPFLFPVTTLADDPGSVADHVVISEIQADSVAGSGGTADDWIELYNPTSQSIDLAAGNYRIEKTQTASDPSIVIRIGNSEDGSYPGGTIIPARGFYLIVREDASEELRAKADAIGKRGEFTWTGNGYTLYLGTGPISSDQDADIVDKVGFGPEASYYEGSGPAPEIPEGKSLQRKVSDTTDEDGTHGPAWDTDDNNADFFIQDSPNPQNSSSEPLPPVPELPTIILFSAGLIALAVLLVLKRHIVIPKNSKEFCGLP